MGKLRWEGARPDARRDAHFLSQLHCFTQHYTTLHYTTLHYIASNYITVHYIHTTQLVHTQLTHTYSSTHDLIILNQHQSVTISFLFPAFPLPSLGLSSQCCSRHAGKNGLLCAVLLLGSLAHLVLQMWFPGIFPQSLVRCNEYGSKTRSRTSRNSWVWDGRHQNAGSKGMVSAWDPEWSVPADGLTQN